MPHLSPFLFAVAGFLFIAPDFMFPLFFAKKINSHHFFSCEKIILINVNGIKWKWTEMTLYSFKSCWKVSLDCFSETENFQILNFSNASLACPHILTSCRRSPYFSWLHDSTKWWQQGVHPRLSVTKRLSNAPSPILAASSPCIPVAVKLLVVIPRIKYRANLKRKRYSQKLRLVLPRVSQRSFCGSPLSIILRPIPLSWGHFLSAWSRKTSPHSMWIGSHFCQVGHSLMKTHIKSSIIQPTLHLLGQFVAILQNHLGCHLCPLSIRWWKSNARWPQIFQGAITK